MSRRRKIAIALILLIIVIAIVTLAYLNIINIRWIIGNTPPSIVLISPSHNQTITQDYVNFTWESYDPDGDTLYHFFMFDTLPTMNSPLFEGHDTGQQTYYNYTNLKDGVWWWKVEVSDMKDYNVSETRRLVVHKNLSNHFPELLYPIVFPHEGTRSTYFTYRVIYLDEDGDEPEYVKVLINGVPYNMYKEDENDTDYANGVAYKFVISDLPIGNNTFAIYASDGQAVVSTDVYNYPTVYAEGSPYLNHPPQIKLIAPANGAILTSKTVTFLYNVTDIDNNLVKTELHLYKNNLKSPRQTYTIDSGDSLVLGRGTYYWRIVAYDKFTMNQSEIWSFSVDITEKQNKITIQPDNTIAHPGEKFTGTLIITNEGDLQSYEVFWYVYLKDENGEIIAQDSGAMAISTTIEVRYSLDVPYSAKPGNYTIDAYTYDSPLSNASKQMLGHDSLHVNVLKRKIEYTTILPIFAIILLMLASAIVFRNLPLLATTLAITTSIPVILRLMPIHMIALSFVPIALIYLSRKYQKYRYAIYIALGAFMVLYFLYFFLNFV